MKDIPLTVYKIKIHKKNQYRQNADVEKGNIQTMPYQKKKKSISSSASLHFRWKVSIRTWHLSYFRTENLDLSTILIEYSVGPKIYKFWLITPYDKTKSLIAIKQPQTITLLFRRNQTIDTKRSIRDTNFRIERAAFFPAELKTLAKKPTKRPRRPKKHCAIEPRVSDSDLRLQVVDAAKANVSVSTAVTVLQCSPNEGFAIQKRRMRTNQNCKFEKFYDWSYICVLVSIVPIWFLCNLAR